MIKNNLKIARERKAFSSTELGKMIGVAHQTILQWEKGQRKFSIENATKLAPHLDVTVGQLLGLESLDNSKESSSKNISKNDLQLTHQYYPEDYIDVPIVHQELACGTGIEPLSYQEVEYTYLHKKMLRDFGSTTIHKIVIMKTIGDSMEPLILPKSWVIIDTGDTDLNCRKKSIYGNIFAFRYEGSLYIKELKFNKKTKILLVKSFNTEQKSFEISLDEFTDFVVVGRVLGTYNKF
ncbi:S24 family peptidase [Rickettsiales bacterium LUAb2]